VCTRARRLSSRRLAGGRLASSEEAVS
jgi:hypothetical protein